VAEHVLELRGVCKTYGQGQAAQEVLHGVDLDLAKGEFSALIGPSGSGKSTLLNLVGLLDRPTAGTLSIVGQTTTGLDDGALTRLRGSSIGFVFQYHHLIAAFTALENVMMPLLVARGRPTPEMQARAAELLRLVGLERFQDQRTDQLSGGQQQRVAIARALAADPPLVLADEPTGNLDTRSADGVFALLREVNDRRGTTFLIVTHDPRLAQRCDRIVELVDGRIVNDRPRPAGGWEPSAGATL
jgi:lipoprotein-releasing system ATP-binding protein